MIRTTASYGKVLTPGLIAQPTLWPPGNERLFEEHTDGLLYPCLSCFRLHRLCVSGSSRNADPYPDTNGDARSHSNAGTAAHADGIAYRHSYPHAHARDGANACGAGASFLR